MHKEKVSGMSHKGFFFNQEQKKIWEFFLDVFFINTSNVNLLDAFYR